MAKLDTTGTWKVNNSPLYVPSAGIQVSHTNLAGSSSGRTEDGIMHIDWIRRDIRKVHLQWKVLTASEMDYVLGLMQGKEFTLTFKDRGKVQTMNAYSSESSYTYYSAALGEDIYTDVSINAIEM
ncbi:MAG: hypothetical protein IKW20_05955 [Bacteroidales bacterium]|nr:hypothetical protein [Bacteroidales bacterium]